MTEQAVCQVVEISSGLRDLLDRESLLELTVHSVFNKAANLLSAEQDLVTLASADRHLMPMGLLLVPGLQGLDLRGGQRILYKEGLFYLPGGIVDTRQSRVRRTALPTPLWQTSRTAVRSLSWIKHVLTEEDRGGIASLAAFLDGNDPAQGKGPLNLYGAFILNDLRLFLQAYGEGRLDLAGELAGRLIGFGPGLTPSCDDFLKGVCLSLYYDINFGPGHPQAAGFFEKIRVLAKDKTTLVSHHMLIQATAGHAGTLDLELLTALARDDLEALKPLARNLLCFGASSGADFLLGLCCAQARMPDRIKYPADKIKQAGGLERIPPATKTG